MKKKLRTEILKSKSISSDSINSSGVPWQCIVNKALRLLYPVASVRDVLECQIESSDLDISDNVLCSDEETESSHPAIPVVLPSYEMSSQTGLIDFDDIEIDKQTESVTLNQKITPSSDPRPPLSISSSGFTLSDLYNKLIPF